jgi:ribulose-5-phosphate 4-epimerase/fuculose-1-phosphate aldolase
MASIIEEVLNKGAKARSISPEEWQTRVDLAAAHRLAVVEGWQERLSIFNHFTARVPGEPDHMLIKPHDLLFGEVTASNLVKVSLTGRDLDIADYVNGGGFSIHSAVFLARPDVNASLHVHGSQGRAIAALEKGLMYLSQEAMRFYNRIGYHAYEGIAAPNERENLARDLGKNNALILRNHGVLTCGPSIAAAALDLQNLMCIADVQLRILSTGQPVTQPSREIIEKTAAAQSRLETRQPWAAIRRWLDKNDPGYGE